jgi:hypothetical protein
MATAEARPGQGVMEARPDSVGLGVTARALRYWASSHPLLPYETLETNAREISPKFRTVVELRLQHGYTVNRFSIPSVVPPIDWSAHNRSFSLQLHSWDAISELLSGYSVYADERYLQAAVAYARSWIAEFQVPTLQHHSTEELDRLVIPHMPTEWYDMAVGQRCYRLAYLLDVLARREDTDDSELETLWRSLRFHLLLLNRDHFFRGHTNHGLYQALGHLAAARRFIDLPGMAAEHETAQGRVLAVLAAHFSDEGPHKEHSPGYHYMLMGTLINARRCGLLDSEEIAARIARIESAIVWMVTPESSLVTIGDTDPREMYRGERAARLHRDEALRYIVSGGKIGTPPPTGVRAYYEAGYAFARLYADGVEREPQNASYLAQIAAFHSRVHKHADHLAFVWHDGHREILIDPARYAYAGRTEKGSELHEQGFWYSDPKRIYCESTRAHNTVEIDGTSFPRARVKPFGSALVYAGEVDGCAVTYCEATLFRSIRHSRQLVMAPGRFLLVLDWLYDRTGAPHDYRQYFHFAPRWQVAVEDGIVVAHHPGVDTLPLALRAASLVDEATLGPVVRGQEEPQLLGWLSDKAYSLVPTTCFHVHRRSNEPTSLVTLFVLGSTLRIDRKRTRFNRSLSAGQVAWTDDHGPQSIEIKRPEPARSP